MSKQEKIQWYEVLEPSYIGDRLYQVGDEVQYEGEAGSNLKPISAKEAKARLKEEEEPDEVDLKARELELNKREDEIIEREKKVQSLADELEEVQEKADKRAEDLNEREKALSDLEVVLREREKVLPVQTSNKTAK